ncbi:MAG: hypothetical protein ACK4PK_07765 [Alphaproteobacteria bacterium]
MMILLGSISLPSHAQSKQEKPLVACDQNQGIGSVFYDFDALIVYYSTFMTSSPRQDSKFPQALRHDVFNARLIEKIKENFSLCLKTKEGKQKPIYVFFLQSPPDMDTRGMNCDDQSVICRNASSEKIHEMIENPKNLTLVLRGDYSPQQEIASGVMGTGFIYTYWYRPETLYKSLGFSNNVDGSIVVLPPLNGMQSIEERLKAFFEALSPRKVYSDYKPPGMGDTKIMQPRYEFLPTEK